jgi:hypothetical protein
MADVQPTNHLLTLFVRVSPLRGGNGIFQPYEPCTRMLRLWLRIHFARYGKVLRLRLAASYTSDQRNHQGGRDGQCVGLRYGSI